MPTGRRESDETRVVVSSDLTLIAETIGAGLRSRGLQAVVVPWWSGNRVPRPRRGDAEVPAPAVLLLVCDLGLRPRLDEARTRGRVEGVPWVVMTDSDRGPAWGAVLEAGARGVVASTVSLTDLVELLRAVDRGESLHSRTERVELLHEWSAAELAGKRLRARMRSLSPREQEVLSMLYEGTTVREIAEQLGVTEATVRSQVKSVLRKLAVASQLAAVAEVHRLRDAGGSE